jgi:hypothetical protein
LAIFGPDPLFQATANSNVTKAKEEEEVCLSHLEKEVKALDTDFVPSVER